MIDYERINARMKKLKEYAGYLKEYQKADMERLKNDYTLQGAVLHYLQLSIECVIDIGEILISNLNIRKPQDAREVIEILGEYKIIPDDFAKKFCTITGFRNILVHGYIKIDLAEVHKHLLADLEDFDSYARQIAKFLQKQKSRNS